MRHQGEQPRKGCSFSPRADGDTGGRMFRHVRELRIARRKRRSEMSSRLAQFRALFKAAGEETLFAELCFCIMTANANALLCDAAHKELCAKGLFLKGRAAEIAPYLRGKARFHNKKAGYIVRARNFFLRSGRLDVRGRLAGGDAIVAREWLVDHVKGLGYKEASHFLRNIGLGRNIAILDRHILKNLIRHGVIRVIPSSVASRAAYVGIENKMRAFSDHIGIPMDELDLLFWSFQTGFIFK